MKIETLIEKLQSFALRNPGCEVRFNPDERDATKEMVVSVVSEGIDFETDEFRCVIFGKSPQ